MRAFVILLVLVPVAYAQTSSERDQAIAYLKSMRQPDGGFRNDTTAKASSLRATSAAIRAFKYLNAPLPEPEAARKFILRCRDSETGTFRDHPDSKMTDCTANAVGIMGILELDPKEDVRGARDYLIRNAKSYEERRLAVAAFEATKEFPSVVADWLREVDQSAQADGTFGQKPFAARETGGAIAMKLRTGQKLADPVRKSVVELLKAAQMEDGGYSSGKNPASDLETTYRVMRAMHLLGEKPPHPEKLQALITKCAKPTGGYGTTPEAPASCGGTYYAAIIRYWLKK